MTTIYERLHLASQYLHEADAELKRMRLRDWFHLIAVHATSRWRTKSTLTFVLTTVFRIAYISRVTIRGKTAWFVFITRRRKDVYTLDAFVCSRSRFALTAAPACAIWVLRFFELSHSDVKVVYAEIARENRAAKATLKAAGFVLFKSNLKREVWRYG